MWTCFLIISSRASDTGSRSSPPLLSLVFAVTVTVLTAQFWKEAWDQQWLSDTMWRARLWIPYASMPIGLGLLSLQCLADLWRLVARKDAPFGIRKERTS